MTFTSFIRLKIVVCLLVFGSFSTHAQRGEIRVRPNPDLILQLANSRIWKALPNSAQKRKKDQPVRPNIIFILTDDHRADALGAMGNKIIQTPNLDALASRGILFKKAYVTTSICCISRASILSGQYQSRHKINDFNTPFTKKALDKTYPALLKKSGYKLGFIGKFGIDGKQQPDSLFDYWASAKEEQPAYEMHNKDGQPIHHTDSVGKDIKQFLGKFAGKEPFCLSVSFKAPHELDGRPPTFPVQEKFKSLYQNVRIPEPLTADAKYWNSFPNWFKTDKNIARERWKPLLSTPALREETTKNYYRLITGVDEVVGNMVAQLKELQIDGNTIIIFMGDNGFSLGEHGLEGKWYAYEESVRIPMFISGAPLPRKMRGHKTDRIALNIDIAPTILALAGVPVPPTMQGKDLIAMAKKKSLARDDFFYEHTFLGGALLPKVEAVVAKNFKYMKYIEHNYEELYNTKKDPFETTNLAQSKAGKAELTKLRKRYGELKRSAR